MEDLGLTELLFRRTEAQSNVFSSALIPNFDVIDEVSADQPSVDSLLVACLKPVPPGEVDRQRIMIHSCLGDANSIRPVSKPLHSSALAPDMEVVALKSEYCSVNEDESFLMLAFAYVKKKGEAGICIHRLPSSEMRDLTRLQGCSLFGNRRLAEPGKVILPLESASVLPLKTLPWQIISAKFSEHGELKLAIVVSHVLPATSVKEAEPLSVFAFLKNGEFISVSNYKHFFPEFCNCESQVFCMESAYQEDRMQRVTAWGTDTGTFEVTCVALSYENQVVFRFSFDHSTPITAIRLFPEFVLPRRKSPTGRVEDMSNVTPALHLLVCSAAEPTVVYTDPCNHGLGLDNQIVLSESADHDCVLSCCFVDLDLDGIDEVVLGTYSGHLLAYKQSADDGSLRYSLTSRQKVGGPVLAIHIGDMTGDGVKEMAVVTTRGIHIMQYPLQVVMDRLVDSLSEELD